MTGIDSQEFDWNHVYLLGWYDSKGTSYLSTWIGAIDNRVEVVVVGFDSAHGPPLWNAPVPNDCVLLAIPISTHSFDERIAYATSVGGVYAFGCLSKNKIDRQNLVENKTWRS